MTVCPKCKRKIDDWELKHYDGNDCCIECIADLKNKKQLELYEREEPTKKKVQQNQFKQKRKNKISSLKSLIKKVRPEYFQCTVCKNEKFQDLGEFIRCSQCKHTFEKTDIYNLKKGDTILSVEEKEDYRVDSTRKGSATLNSSVGQNFKSQEIQERIENSISTNIDQKRFGGDKDIHDEYDVYSEEDSEMTIFWQDDILDDDILDDNKTKDSFTIKRTRWGFLNYNQLGERISKEEKKELASKFLLEEIIPILYKDNIIESGQTPTIKNLRESGYGGYYKALRLGRHLVNYSEIIIESNLDSIYNDWSFLDYNKNGKKLTSTETLNEIIKHFKTVVIQDLVKKKVINKGQTPKQKDLGNHFLALVAYRNRGVSFNNLLKFSGFVVNRQVGLFKFINFDIEGVHLNREQKILIARDYFINIIIPDLVKKKIIQEGQTPKLSDLSNNGYSAFCRELKDRGNKISYNTLIQASQMETNYNHRRWLFLDCDKDGNLLKREDSLRKAAKYFKKKLIPDLIMKGVIEEGETPRIFQLTDNGYRGFLNNLSRKNITYNDIVRAAGYKVNIQSIFSYIGILFHWIAKRVFLEHTRLQNCKSFYEIYQTIYSKKFAKNHVDGCIIIDDNFKQLSFNAQRLAEKYSDKKIINFDFYLTDSKINVKIHSERGYQGKNKLLVLVPLNAISSYCIDEDILKIDPIKFIRLLGIKGNLQVIFLNGIELTKSAIISEEFIPYLEELAYKCKEVIKSTYNYNQSMFKKYLTSNNLLHLFQYSNNKKNKEILDWFD